MEGIIMSKTRTEKCDCGQVTYLVAIAGVEHYNVDVHGSSAVADGRCFNCHKPFVTAQPEAVGDDTAGPVEKALQDMSVRALRALAAVEDISITGLRSKADIVAKIESEHKARTGDEGDEDPGGDDIGDEIE